LAEPTGGLERRRLGLTRTHYADDGAPLWRELLRVGLTSAK
jgi:hypothetical protein